MMVCILVRVPHRVPHMGSHGGTPGFTTTHQIATITMNVIKLIVPVIVQAMQTTVENAVKESLKMIPEVHESNVRILAKLVNDKALTAKYERDDLEQQERKDSLRLYGSKLSRGRN